MCRLLYNGAIAAGQLAVFHDAEACEGVDLKLVNSSAHSFAYLGVPLREALNTETIQPSERTEESSQVGTAGYGGTDLSLRSDLQRKLRLIRRKAMKRVRIDFKMPAIQTESVTTYLK